MEYEERFTVTGTSALPKSRHCQQVPIKDQNKDCFSRRYLLLKANPFQTECSADGKEAGQ